MARSDYRIGDLGVVITGATPPKGKPHLWGGDAAFVTPSEISEAGRLPGSGRRISTAGTAHFSKKMLPEGAICFVCIGWSLGKCCVTVEPSLSNQQINSLIVDESSFDRDYVYYLLCFESDRIIARATGTRTPIVNKSVFSDTSVSLPELKDQRKVGSILRAFDDLIENNRRRIEILEEMARLLYREWFVHFRFPGHEDVELVDSELGPIPEGWEVAGLFDLAEVGFGYSFKSKQFGLEGAFPVVRIRDIPKHRTETFTDEVSDKRYEIHDGDTLIGMDGDFHMCRWADGLAYLNQRVTRIRATGKLGQMALHLSIEPPIQHFNRTIIGTTVAHLGKRHLQEIRVPVPDTTTAQVINEKLEPLMILEANLRKQNRVLREARDLLLPRLISGELDVSELDLDGVLA